MSKDNPERNDDRAVPAFRPPQALDVFLLGRVELVAAVTLQQWLAHEISTASEHTAALLLCEHPPCVSCGTGPLTEWDGGGEPVISVTRPGGRVEHGPGQLAIYPVVSLARMEISPLGWTGLLTRILQATLIDLATPEVHAEGESGIGSRVGQLARYGLHVQDDVSRMGAYLNVSLAYPLAETGRFTCLTAALLRPVEISSIKQQIVQQFETALENPRINVYTRHPLLRRMTRNEAKNTDDQAQ